MIADILLALEKFAGFRDCSQIASEKEYWKWHFYQSCSGYSCALSMSNFS